MTRFVLHIMMYISTVSVLAQPASGEQGDTLRAQVDSLEVQALLDEGDVHYQQFENRLALDAYFKAYEMAPTSYEVLTRLARTTNDYGLDLKAEEREVEARQALEDALNYAQSISSNYPEEPVAHSFLALIKKNLALLVTGREKIEFGREVETHCVKGLDMNPTDPELYVTYAVFNRDIASMNWIQRTLNSAVFGQVPEGSPELALEMLQKALKLNPSLHITHYELAVTYIGLGLYDEAVPYLQNALKLKTQTTQDIRNQELAHRMLNRIQR